MRVGIYGAYNSRDTGPSRVTEGLAAALVDAEIDVEMFVHGDRREPPRESIELTHLGETPSSIWGFLGIQRAAREQMSDVEITHALGGHYAPATVTTVQWTSGEYERWQRAPRDFGGYRALTGDLLLNGARRIGATRSNVVIASSPETARQIRHHWRMEPDLIVPLGIETRNEPETFDLSDPPRVLIPGRITQKKGQKRVLNHLDTSIDARIDLVGHVADEQYRNEIPGDWNYHGFVERARLKKFYRAADVAVVPSYHENFSMTALEAVASGCALVITETCGFAQFDDVRESDGVTVVENGREAAAAVERRLSDHEVLRKHKRVAYNLSAHYLWSEIAPQYRELYDEAR